MFIFACTCCHINHFSLFSQPPKYLTRLYDNIFYKSREKFKNLKILKIKDSKYNTIIKSQTQTFLLFKQWCWKISLSRIWKNSYCGFTCYEVTFVKCKLQKSPHFLLYFGAKTIWYLHSHLVCDKLFMLSLFTITPPLLFYMRLANLHLL